MTKLAETYFRLGIHLSGNDQDKFKALLMDAAYRAADGLFHQAPEIAVYLEEGSLRGWIVVAGRIAVAIGIYAGFHDGVDDIVKDGRTFSHAMVSMITQSGVKQNEVLRTEKRTAVPGKLSRLLADIDDLKAHGRDLSKAEYNERMDKIKNRALKLFRVVEEEQDRSLILDNIPGNVRARLPKQLPHPIEINPPVALRPEELQPSLPYFGRRPLIGGEPNGNQSWLTTTNVPVISTVSHAFIGKSSEPSYRVDVSAHGVKLVRK